VGRSTGLHARDSGGPGANGAGGPGGPAVGGRTTKIIRYEGALSSWDPNTYPLKVIGFGYGSAGELATISYPSTRTVTYSYGNDKERPTSVSTSALGTVASGIAYEPSGAPSFWKLEGTTGRDRTVTRDYLGRVTRLLDRYGTATWSDVGYTYDGDGDVLTEADNSPSGTWLRRGTTAPQSRAYTYDTGNQRDLLKSWSDDGLSESVTYGSDGRRTSEADYPGPYTYNYTYSSTYPERLLDKSSGSVTSNQEVVFDYQTNDGSITRVDASANGTWDTTYGYGYFGQVATSTTSSGTSTNQYDFEERLVGVNEPTGYTRRMRYAFGRAPLEETYTTTSGTWRYETIYLAGEAIAQVATSPTAGATLRNLHTDRMGVVRKTASTTGTRLQRVVIDAWGGTNSASSAVVVDNSVEPMPGVNWRYPGQYYTGSNGWRQYLPLVGQYSSVEPLHYEAAQRFVGPQAYAYAAARPLMYTDSDGLRPRHSCELEAGIPDPLCESEFASSPAPSPTPTPAPPGPGSAIGSAVVGALCALGIFCPPELPEKPHEKCDDEKKKRDDCERRAKAAEELCKSRRPPEEWGICTDVLIRVFRKCMGQPMPPNPFPQ
jgi:RHS repeat-associated protein